MDVFDWVEVIGKMKDEGYTQQEIADRIGWSRQKVSQYLMLTENIATQILNLSKEQQKGRVADNATNVANFTEGWFRNSGLYDLNEKHQVNYPPLIDLAV